MRNKYSLSICNSDMHAGRYTAKLWRKQIKATERMYDNAIPDDWQWNTYTDYDLEGQDNAGDDYTLTFADAWEFSRKAGYARHDAWLNAFHMTEDAQPSDNAEWVCVFVELLDADHKRIDYACVGGFYDDNSATSDLLMLESANDMKAEIMHGKAYADAIARLELITA